MGAIIVLQLCRKLSFLRKICKGEITLAKKPPQNNEANMAKC